MVNGGNEAVWGAIDKLREQTIGPLARIETQLSSLATLATAQTGLAATQAAIQLDVALLKAWADEQKKKHDDEEKFRRDTRLQVRLALLAAGLAFAGSVIMAVWK